MKYNTKLLVITLFVSMQIHSQKAEELKYFTEDNPGVWCSLKKMKIVEDSLILQSRFYNLSNETITLYKPLLPDNMYMKYRCISINNESGETYNQESSKIKSTDIYFETIDTFIPVVIPLISDSTIFPLNAGDSVDFQLNVSRFFNIDNLSEKSRLSIQYAVFMPAIDDSVPTQKLEDVKNGKKNRIVSKPVYYRLGSKVLFFPTLKF